jgi:hypothetical protein
MKVKRKRAEFGGVIADSSRGRHPAHEHRQTHTGEYDADGPADRREKETFREPLANDSTPARA